MKQHYHRNYMLKFIKLNNKIYNTALQRPKKKTVFENIFRGGRIKKK